MVTLFVFVMGLISVTISIVLVYKKKIQEFNPMSFLIFVLLLIFILAIVSMKYWNDSWISFPEWWPLIRGDGMVYTC